MAKEILLVVVETQREHLVACTFAWQRAPDRAGGNTLSYVAGDRHPPVIASDLIAIDHQFDTAVVPVVTSFQQAVNGTRIHDVALCVVGSHDVAIRIVENTGVA